MLGQFQTAVGRAKDVAVGHPDIGKADARVVGRHVEGPEIFLDFHALGLGRNDETGNALGVTGLALGAGKNHHVGGHVHAGGPHFLAVDAPARNTVAGFAHTDRFHVCGVRAVLGFGQAEADRAAAIQHTADELVLLVLSAKVAEHQHLRIVGDDGVFVLKVVVQTQTLGGEMLADHGHGQIGAVLAAKLLGQGKTQVTGLVGALLGFGQQFFPLVARQAAIVIVGACPFTAMVEEALVVVLRLQRNDFGLDEGIQFGQIVGDLCG